MNEFHNAALKQLTDQQVRYAPAGRRLEQLARAEKLLGEIDTTRQYPYQYVCYRVTDFRSDQHPEMLLDGAELIHDLTEMIGLLGRSVPPVPLEEVELPALTLEEISKRWNVSTKTIGRWRNRGLVGRRVLCNGRQQVAYVQSVVDRFLAANRDWVERGGKFSHLSDAEREEILRRARRMARVAGGNLTEVARRIARRLGRSTEAVRCTIKNYDRDHPAQALFPACNGVLDNDMKQTIYSSYRRGIAVDTLAKKFQRTRTSVYRVINEVRAQRLLAQPLDYIHNASFDDPSREAEILAPMPDEQAYEARRRDMKAPKDVPPELANLYEVPLLNKEQEQHLFRKMNFLKHKADGLRKSLCRPGDDEIDPARVRIQALEEIEQLQAEANGVKDQLISANMRLVVNIAKRHSGQTDNFFELLSDGNMSLIRAVEKFDFGRGFKFSTYASWAIMKNFARSIPDEKHRRERFLTGHDEVFEVRPDGRTDEHEVVATQERATHSVNRLLEYLEPREREIIRMRAGLDDHHKGMTLEEIGKEFGITKERVRQLHARSMKKLRTLAEKEDFESMS